LHWGCEPLYQIAGLFREMLSLGPVAAVPPAHDTGMPTPHAFISNNPTSKPTVSILIPAFNAKKWIAGTLRSASSRNGS
jgi:hypothetical protein